MIGKVRRDLCDEHELAGHVLDPDGEMVSMAGGIIKLTPTKMFGYDYLSQSGGYTYMWIRNWFEWIKEKEDSNNYFYENQSLTDGDEEAILFLEKGGSE